jgi:hypothetical protein
MPAYPPRSAFEPPAAAAARSLAESSAASPVDLLTVAEKTNWRDTGRHADSLALARRLEKASPFVKVLTIGTTPQGRDLFIVVVSKDKAFSPAAAKATRKPIIFLQSCIHPGEVDGKEASEMLLRDIVVSRKFASWLDQAIIVSLPIFNADGHERLSAHNRINQDGPSQMGFRATAERLNLNRDFTKADAPEMQAWLRFFTAWLPDFFIDNHVTDGADFQYDITIDVIESQEIWPAVGQWVKTAYLPFLEDAMSTDGHVMGWYGGPVDRNDPSKGFAKATYTPRYSHGYAAVQNRPALLVETHSLKSFKTRSWAHYDVMRRSIEAVVRNPQALMDAVREADRAVAALAGTPTPVHLDGRLGQSESRPYTFKTLKMTSKESDLAGAPITVYEKEPINIETRLLAKVDTTAAASVPAGYLVPAEWTTVIQRLELHGVKIERLTRPVNAEAESYHLFDVRFSPVPFEGRFGASFKTKLNNRKITVPAGTVWVPMNQRSARVALNILEPDAPDSLVRWGLMHAIFEQKEYFSDYVMEPIARQMALSHPELKREFDAKLASDVAFAKNARQRLAWWFERSPYYEDDKDVYPVLRVAKKTW